MMFFYAKTGWLRWLLGILCFLGSAVVVEVVFLRLDDRLVAYFFPVEFATLALLVLYGLWMLIVLPFTVYRRQFKTAVWATLQLGYVIALLLVNSFTLAVLGGSVGGH